MTNDDHGAVLRHMLDALDVARQIVLGGKEAFDLDPVPRLASDTVISRLAECANKLPAAVLADMPEVPWPVVRSMRNRLQHASLDTDYDLVWQVLVTKLPDIDTAIRRLLD